MSEDGRKRVISVGGAKGKGKEVAGQPADLSEQPQIHRNPLKRPQTPHTPLKGIPAGGLDFTGGERAPRAGRRAPLPPWFTPFSVEGSAPPGSVPMPTGGLDLSATGGAPRARPGTPFSHHLPHTLGVEGSALPGSVPTSTSGLDLSATGMPPTSTLPPRHPVGVTVTGDSDDEETEEDAPTLPRDRRVHFAEEPEVMGAELLGYITSEPVRPDPNLKKEEPQYFKLFNPDIAEDLDCILRSYKLKNQVGTQQLRFATENSLTTPISEIAEKANEKLITNLNKQANRTDLTTHKHSRGDHYSVGGFTRLDQDTKNIHQGIQTETQDNKTIIKLLPRTDSSGAELPERTITTWPEEDKKRIMYSVSGTDPYALMVFKESVLSGAKEILKNGGKANFVIFIPPKDPTNFAAVARVCAMANCIAGLTPIFQTRPGCNPDEAITFNKDFIRHFAKPELIRDPSLDHPEKSENDTLRDAAAIIKPQKKYGPPEHTKYPSKP